MKNSKLANSLCKTSEFILRNHFICCENASDFYLLDAMPWIVTCYIWLNAYVRLYLYIFQKEKHNINGNNNKEICKYKQEKTVLLWAQCRFYALMNSQGNVLFRCSFIFTLWGHCVWSKNKSRQKKIETGKVNSNSYGKYLSSLSGKRKKTSVCWRKKHFGWIDWIKLTTHVIAVI